MFAIQPFEPERLSRAGEVAFGLGCQVDPIVGMA